MAKIFEQGGKMKHGTDDLISFNELSKEIMVNNDEWSFKAFAKDPEVYEKKTILAWSGVDRQKLVEYVVKYGYEMINMYVLELGEALRNAEVKS